MPQICTFCTISNLKLKLRDLARILKEDVQNVTFTHLSNDRVSSFYLFYNKFWNFRVSKFRIGCPKDRWNGILLKHCSKCSKMSEACKSHFYLTLRKFSHGQGSFYNHILERTILTTSHQLSGHYVHTYYVSILVAHPSIYCCAYFVLKRQKLWHICRYFLLSTKQWTCI